MFLQPYTMIKKIACFSARWICLDTYSLTVEKMIGLFIKKKLKVIRETYMERIHTRNKIRHHREGPSKSHICGKETFRFVH